MVYESTYNWVYGFITPATLVYGRYVYSYYDLSTNLYLGCHHLVSKTVKQNGMGKKPETVVYIFLGIVLTSFLQVFFGVTID